MNSHIAIEALLQRGRTPLYNDLVSLYQETQDALRELKKASPAKYNLQLKYIDYPKKLKYIVKTHMGIVITKVDLIESRKANSFATLDISEMLMSGLSTGRKSFVNISQQIASVYDDRHATTDHYIHQEIGFRFGIYIGFWYMRNKDGSFHFTPEEIAAVTLHELGHFDHWIRSISQPINKILDASDIIDYVKDTPNKTTIFLILDKLKESKYLDNSWREVLIITETYFKSTFNVSDPIYKEAIASLETLILSELGGQQVTLVNKLMLWNIGIDFGTVKTQSHDVDAERSADDFAARNGAYEPLASSLKKKGDFKDTNNYFYLKQFMKTPSAIIVSLLGKFKAVFNISAEDISVGYDPIIRRLELIAQTAKHAFSDSELPLDVKKDLSHQIQMVESYIQQREKSPYRIVRKRIKEWKDSVSKFGRIVASPIHSRLPGDYHKLQDANRDLGRHSLYYLAQK